MKQLNFRNSFLISCRELLKKSFPLSTHATRTLLVTVLGHITDWVLGFFTQNLAQDHQELIVGLINAFQ